MAFLDRSELSAAATLGLTDEFLAWQGSNVGKTATLDRFLSELGIWRTIAASAATGMSVTGTTGETTLATINIAAGAMGANGILRVTTLWSMSPNNANNKTGRVKYGGTSFQACVMASVVSAQFMTIIRNRNSASSQITYVASVANQFGTNNAALTTGAVNSATALDVLITGQLGTGTDTITLESYQVEVMKKA